MRTSTSRLQFTDEERETPKLQPYIKKSEKAADKLDAAKAALPKQKKLVKERTFEETTGKAKTRLYFEEQEKPIPGGKAHSNPLSRPAQEAGIFVHNKIHSVEKDNSGVEGAHKSEELAERGARYGTRKLKQGYRSHKLKPYREAAKAEQAAFKANVNFQYHKALHENPQLTSNPSSRFMQKQKIKRQYAKTVKKSGAATAKAASGASQTAAKKAAAFAGRHPAGVIIAIAALLLFIMVSVGLSSCGAMFSGSMNSVLGTSYTSEDSDLVATEQSYAAMENELQQEIDNIESTHSGYDEYRYDLDTIGHTFEAVTAVFECAGQSFTARGKTVLSDGWKEIDRRYRAALKNKPETDDADSDTENTLPQFTEGQTFENPTAKVTEHDTTPPKPHNEASLLSAMERAGSEDTDPDAERKGLGTPATRAAVIEKLVKGGFVERKGKQLLPTKDGINLVCVLPNTLTSPQLTAEWENNLTQIAKGKADPAAFMEGIEDMARELVKTYPFLSDDKAQMFKPEREALGSCPRCGSPVYEGKKNYYCSNKECIFTMWKNDRFFEERKVTFTPKIAAALLQSGKVNVKKLYSPKTGKTYDGTIVLADTGGKYINYRIELSKKK
ncbi:CD1108 family mobile element protein [Blautia argi]